MKENIAEVLDNIKSTCSRTGRSLDEVTLIAVSKTKPASMIQEAYEQGIRDFGENKVQEILEKQETLPKDIRWHMIGHLQRNKVKAIIDKVALIHSVDSLRLAAQIEKEATNCGLTVDILLEINVSGEESKYGFSFHEVMDALIAISKFPHVHICGFMTVAPFTENPETVRVYFKKLHDFYVDIKSKNIDNVAMSVLSMGMSGDYQVAIEEGATMIRVGTGIFGFRDRKNEER